MNFLVVEVAKAAQGPFVMVVPAAVPQEAEQQVVWESMEPVLLQALL